MVAALVFALLLLLAIGMGKGDLADYSIGVALPAYVSLQQSNPGFEVGTYCQDCSDT